jgi:hypothetical protein
MKKFNFTISAVLVLNLLFSQTADLHQFNKIIKDSKYGKSIKNAMQV